MPSERINATPDQIRAKAKEVDGLKENHDQAIKDLGILLNNLTDVFEGEAQVAIVEEYNEMKAVFENFSNLLYTFAELLRSNADRVEREDIERRDATHKGFS